nr:MAG TPA: hypothetical protein [Caudoviricetes sp.]
MLIVGYLLDYSIVIDRMVYYLCAVIIILYRKYNI